ncbi:MAG: ABC transporter permease [Prevotellaceae bacterium]|jgi:ABC-2 type transport system permease protein|nr:ABC transporter permease [Prevotellaceae bacterium]
MKQFLSFVRKEFKHIFRDKRTMLILLGMPIVQIILFGFAITTEVQNVRVAIVDPSKDISTQHIIDKINASKYFEVKRVINATNQIEKVFRHGEVDLAIVFEERFNENLNHTGKARIRLIADATDPNTAITEVNYATSIVAAVQQEMIGTNAVPIQIIPEVKMLYNPQMESAYSFVPGVMGLILMLICAMMTSISIVREKETGTMEVLLVSPMKPIYIILSKAMPYFVLSCVNLINILLLSVFVLGVPIAGSLVWLVVVSFMFIMVCLSLGLLISTIAKTQVAAMLMSGMVLMMPALLLSGMIYPVENMPAILEWISNIVPARWFISSVRKLMIQGLDVSYVLKEIAILTGMAIFLIVVSLKKFKVRLQ